MAFHDPVICGPLSPFPMVENQRPLNSGSIILPKRISNYTLDFEYGPVTLSDVSDLKWLFSPTPSHVRCSFLDEHKEVFRVWAVDGVLGGGGGRRRPSLSSLCRPPGRPLFICRGFFVIYRCTVFAHSTF